MEQKIHYRRDIDGLRAIAVLSVLAYHLKIGLFRGGFVGVDIFFVISGYLISSIILKDLASGKFSIATFYARRIRRIFPALVVALIGTAVLAYLYFLPTELVGFSKSLLAAVFSTSNIYFCTQSGYFSAPIETEPLIHTWSLAVEEQFYLFLPIFLLLVHRYLRRKLRTTVILIALLSFVVSAVGAFRFPVSTFYLPHARAWELLLGVLISLQVFPEIRTSYMRNTATLLGLGSIAVGVFGISATTPFPGLAALAPCVGAALIIAAGRSGPSLIGKALSFKPVVFIGLISYSLYLWHWPIIVFQGMESVLISGASVRLTKLICTIVSIVAATLSWKFVELPFRRENKRLSRGVLFKLATATAVLIAAVGLSAVVSRGFPSRYPIKAVQVASYLDYNSADYFREGTCFISSNYKVDDYDAAKCLHQDVSKKNYLLFGDSHAAQFWYGLSHTLEGVNVLQATASGCKPTIDQRMFVAPTCDTLMNYIYAQYLPKQHVDRLLIAARWQDRDIEPLARTLDWTNEHGIRVVLFGPMFQYDTALPRLLAFSIRGNDPSIPDEHRVDEHKLDDAMADLARRKGIDYISFYKSLCGAHSCPEFGADGVPLQFDYGHLTKEGSVLVVQRLLANGELSPSATPPEHQSAQSK